MRHPLASTLEPGDAFCIDAACFGVVLSVNDDRGVALVQVQNGLRAEAWLTLVEAGRRMVEQYRVTTP
jgi:hypothetical protein